MIILKPDRVVTARDDETLEDAVVVVDEGRISSIENGSFETDEPGAVTVDLPGCTLMPGLIDMHVHLGYFYREQDGLRYDAAQAGLLAYRNAREALSLGVTTIRDAGSPFGAALALRRAQRAGHVRVPRIVASGLPVAMTGGHGSEEPTGVIEADGPYSVRAAVRLQHKQGADFIKLMGNSGPTLEYTYEEIEAAVDEAHRLGHRIAVHASIRPSIERAICAGADTIEHGSHMTRELAASLASSGNFWVPTITAYRTIARRAVFLRDHPEVTVSPFEAGLCANVDRWLWYWDAYQKAFDAGLAEGVRIVTGTDIVLPGAPICPVSEEVATMVELGMKPIEALRAATLRAAEALGLNEELGSIEAGKAANLLAVQGDPLEHMTALRAVDTVLLDGEVVVRRGMIQDAV